MVIAVRAHCNPLDTIMSYYQGELLLRTEVHTLRKCINEDHIDEPNGIMLQM